MLIMTPSGPCPYNLEGKDMASVKEWVNKLNTKFVGQNYSWEAYRYWIRHTYDIHGPDFKEAVANLKEIMCQE